LAKNLSGADQADGDKPTTMIGENEQENGTGEDEQKESDPKKIFMT